MCECLKNDFTQYITTSRVDWNGQKPFSISQIYDGFGVELTHAQIISIFGEDVAYNVLQTKNWINGSGFHKPVISSYPITLSTYYLNIII